MFDLTWMFSRLPTAARPLLTMLLVLSLSAALLGVSAGPSPAAEVADLPSASGGTQHVWYDSPTNPWAVAIMFVGGNGKVPFEADGSLKGGVGTLTRTRQLWLDQGVAVLIPGKPSSITVEYAYRLTAEYSQDMRSLVNFARAHASAPIWLLGHSSGTNAAAHGASQLVGGEIAGVVFVSPVSQHGPSEKLTEAVVDVPLAAIKVPALVVAHQQDACPNTPPDGATRLRAALTGSPATELFLLDGGQPSGGPCDPTALHSLVGLDAEFVARVVGWMRSR